MRDGTSVHSGDSCWDRFWCKTARAPATAWYAALPAVRSAYYSTSIPKPASPRHHHHTILVAVHYRSVKRRRLNNGFYSEIINALIARHRAWTEQGQHRRKLRIEIHGDQDVAHSGMLKTFANGTTEKRDDVELVVRSVGANTLSFNATPTHLP